MGDIMTLSLLANNSKHATESQVVCASNLHRCKIHRKLEISSYSTYCYFVYSFSFYFKWSSCNYFAICMGKQTVRGRVLIKYLNSSLSTS